MPETIEGDLVESNLSTEDTIRGLIARSHRKLRKTQEDVCDYLSAVWDDKRRAKQRTDALVRDGRLVHSPEGYLEVVR